MDAYSSSKPILSDILRYAVCFFFVLPQRRTCIWYFFQDLITLFSDVLRDASVAEAFWSNSFSTGVSNYVLNEIVYQFYASFRRPLRVLEALASASVDSCQKVYRNVVLCSDGVGERAVPF